MNHTILVYGTLRPNEGSDFRLKGYRMFNLGWYPGIVVSNDDKDSIVVERIIADDDKLAELDTYEGFYPDDPGGSLYLRKKIGKDWIYIYNDPQLESKNCTHIVNGDWVEYKERLVM